MSIDAAKKGDLSAWSITYALPNGVIGFGYRDPTDEKVYTANRYGSHLTIYDEYAHSIFSGVV